MLLPAFTGPAVRGESEIDGEGRSTRVGDTVHRHSAWLMSLVFPMCAARVTRWEPQCWWTAGVASWLQTVTLYAGGGIRKWLKWLVLAPGHSRSYNQAVSRGLGHPQVGWGLDGPQVGPLTWSRQATSGPRPLDSPQGSSPRGEPSKGETRGLRCLCDPASDVTLGHFWRMSVLHRPAPARVGGRRPHRRGLRGRCTGTDWGLLREHRLPVSLLAAVTTQMGPRVPPSSKAQSLWIITWGNPLSPSSPHLKKRKVKGRSLT